MSDAEYRLLELCLKDELFCALYQALRELTGEWRVSSPTGIWVGALKARERLARVARPELVACEVCAAQGGTHESLLVMAVVLYILFTENGQERSTLKDVLIRAVLERGEEWQRVYEAFRNSEGQNEALGFVVHPSDYRERYAGMGLQAVPRSDHDFVHELVDTVLASADVDKMNEVELVLRRVDENNHRRYAGEVDRLALGRDHWLQESLKPRQTQITTSLLQNLGTINEVSGNEHVMLAAEPYGYERLMNVLP